MRSLGTRLSAVVGVALVAGCAIAASSYEGNNNGTIPAVAAAPPMSPLEEYLGLVWGTDLSPEAHMQFIEANILRREELTAECMHLAGFEYVPFTEGIIHFTGESVDWHPNDPEWVAEFGFGVLYSSTSSGIASMPGIFGRESDAVNPNRAIEQSLTETEREAYRRTLHGIPFPWQYDTAGDVVSDEAEAEDWHSDPANWGCRFKAWQQALDETPFGLAQSDQFAPLFEAIEQFQTDFSVEVTDAQHDWAMCMAEAGHSGFALRPNFDRYFRDQLDELTRKGMWFPSWPPGPGAPPAIADFHQREIDMAIADLQCRQAVDFDERQATARVAAETQFVNDHRVDLEALRAAAEQFG